MRRYRVQSFFHPERFQGWGKKNSYFEGWYFKIVSDDASHALAIIPGIAMDAEGNRHAFIQVLDGKKRSATYHSFPFEAFLADVNRFAVRIEENRSSTWPRSPARRFPAHTRSEKSALVARGLFTSRVVCRAS